MRKQSGNSALHLSRRPHGLAKLSRCRQGVAQFLLYDETYPKMKERAYSLGVAMCEHGLICSVRCVTQKAKDIPTQLREVLAEHTFDSLDELQASLDRYLEYYNNYRVIPWSESKQ